MFNEFFSFLPVTDVPVDAGDDGVDVVTSAKTLRINVRSDLVIVTLTWVVINGFIGGMIDVGVDILAELGIALGFFVTVSCVGDVRAVVWTGTLINVDLVAALIADTITGFVPGIDVDV